MILRPAVFSDQMVLFSMHVELFREHIESIWGWSEEWQVTNFKKEWKEAVTEVIEDKRGLLGYIQTRQYSDYVYLLNLALSPKYQGQGLGSEVMNILKQRANLEVLPLRLNVFRTNQRVIEFYKRLDFEVYDETETGYKMQWSQVSFFLNLN